MVCSSKIYHRKRTPPKRPNLSRYMLKINFRIFFLLELHLELLRTWIDEVFLSCIPNCWVFYTYLLVNKYILKIKKKASWEPM